MTTHGKALASSTSLPCSVTIVEQDLMVIISVTSFCRDLLLILIPRTWIATLVSNIVLDLVVV